MASAKIKAALKSLTDKRSRVYRLLNKLENNRNREAVTELRLELHRVVMAVTEK